MRLFGPGGVLAAVAAVMSVFQFFLEILNYFFAIGSGEILFETPDDVTRMLLGYS